MSIDIELRHFKCVVLPFEMQFKKLFDDSSLLVSRHTLGFLTQAECSQRRTCSKDDQRSLRWASIDADNPAGDFPVVPPEWGADQIALEVVGNILGGRVIRIVPFQEDL